MFSDPLLSVDGTRNIEGVQYEEEIYSLKKSLAQANKKLNLKVEVLT